METQQLFEVSTRLTSNLFEMIPDFVNLFLRFKSASSFKVGF
jgi:hypothetical protein